eukprot:jgi/Phyca11/20214/fgenesh1_pg.PHYCAscaffold_59_\
MLLQGMLSLLDLASLASFLEVLAVDESWREVLTHEDLWKEMSSTHFGGKLPPVEQFNGNEEEEESDEEVDQEESDEELQDEDLRDDEEEPDLIEMIEADMDMDDDVSLMGDEEAEDDDSDVVIFDPPPPRRPRSTGQTPAAAQSEAESVPDTRQMDSVTWIEGVPSQKVLGMACPQLAEFLRSSEQLRFMRSTDFSATVGIVCFEADAYAAFVKSKNKLLSQFNADAVLAIPPLRHR